LLVGIKRPCIAGSFYKCLVFLRVIYKYLSSDRVSYLEDQFLRASQQGVLNDPFECNSIPPSVREAIFLCKKSHKDFINKQLDKLTDQNSFSNKGKEILEVEIDKLLNNQHPNYLDYIIQNQANRINSTFGIISFSSRWNSSLMWAHYCKSHEGFCIGFDENHPFFFTNEDSFFTGESVTVNVEYSNSRIKIPTNAEGISFFKKAWRILATKSTDWKYEQEVRTIKMLNKADKRILCHPYDICLFLVPHSAIRELIIGINTPENIRRLIQEFAFNSKISLYQIQLSNKKFALDRLKVV